MKKIILIIFTIFLSSCLKNSNLDDNFKEQWITNSWIFENKSKEEIVKNYYSNDSKNKEENEKWLSNKENFKTTEDWDILEFLDFCENLKKEVNDIQSLNDFLYKKLWKDDYSVIFGTNDKIIDITNIKEKILKHTDNEKDRAWIYYKNMFNDFFNKKDLVCTSYIQ